VRDGQVLATRSRSAATPAAAVRAPAAGTRVGSRGTLSVRWLAADPDGSQGLTSRIEYSADDGKTYRGVAAGLTGTSYSLPIHLLSRSSAARIRITVNDGWNVATAVSRRFRVAGPPPEVEILSPLAGTRIAADQTLNLEGSAFDDRSRILSGKSLRWFDGRRSLGTGPRISVSGLRPGSHTLRLVARDRSGRAGTASVKVRVLAVTPQFVSLSAPSTLSRTARTATVRVASSVAGTLELGKQRFDADRRNRRFKFRIKPGSKTLSLRLVLRSGGRSATATLTIPRS